MAKAKKDLEKEIEAKEVEVKESDEKLVDVAMTEAEKDEFVKFKADQKAKAKELHEDDVEVTLFHVHNLNGQAYGPGKVIVKESIGAYLLRNDQVNARARMAVHESNEYVTHILSQGNTRTTKIVKSDL
jgi:hypothetical protein